MSPLNIPGCSGHGRRKLDHRGLPSRSGAVLVATTKRVYQGKTHLIHLLRRSLRKGTTGAHETLGNRSHLPEHLIALIKRSLSGEPFVPATEGFRIPRARPHGHVGAILTMIRKLGLEHLIASERGHRGDAIWSSPGAPNAFCSSAPSGPTLGTGSTPSWPRNWASLMPPRTRSMPPWTGCSTPEGHREEAGPAAPEWLGDGALGRTDNHLAMMRQAA
jgi:hypothetical protein